MFFLTFFNSCLACESIFYKKTVFFFSFAQKITFLQCFSTLTQFARVPQIEPSWPQGSGHGASVRGCSRELISFSNHWQYYSFFPNNWQYYSTFFSSNHWKYYSTFSNHWQYYSTFFKSLPILFNFFNIIGNIIQLFFKSLAILFIVSK